jgi:poly-gamma-glutamate synthesis protein (capsule biosynthesis protein)
MPEGEDMMAELILLFLCGDVMTGRGIDQVLPHSCDPTLHEPYVKDARRYMALAEQVNGEVPEPVDFNYIWGDALEVLKQRNPDVRVINLETSITTSDDAWPRKGIHYRMHPKNIPAITAAGIDCCVLANNHVMDWGYDGLKETLSVLQEAGLEHPGAGNNRQEAETPGVIEVSGGGRILVFALGWESSGIPRRWAATGERAGVNLLKPTEESVERVGELVGAAKRPGDVVVVSIHWGGNWGYDIPSRQKRFAHRLIDEAGVDLIHGHSSHHVKGFEIYKGHLVLYGCGDFITDYEGISGRERFRGEVSLMYFPRLDPKTGQLVGLEMVPTQIERFRIRRASEENAHWLERVLNREGQQFGTQVKLRKDRVLEATVGNGQ